MYGLGSEFRLEPDSGLHDQGQAQSVIRIKAQCMDQAQGSICNENKSFICVSD